MKSFHRHFLFALLAALALPLSSCMQNSNVIRVSKDGSGEIWSRYYFAPQMAGMLGMMAGGFSELGGEAPGGGAAAQAPDPNSILKPTRESLTASAESFGKGVRYQRHESNKNASGWDGYLVVYEFDDINNLKFDPNNPPGPMSEMADMNPGADAIAEATAEMPEEEMMHFSMADGVLTINTGVSPETLSKVTEMTEGGGGGGMDFPGGPGGPDVDDGGGAGAEIAPEAAMGMAAAMFQGMRMAFFLRIQPGIAETNATHVKGNLITLTDMQPAKMMADPKFIEMTKTAEAMQGQEPGADAIKKIIDSLNDLDGIALETQEKITVKFE